MRVVIVGAGRWGRSLAAYLERAGQPALTVRRGEPSAPCDLAVLCVPDRAIPELARSWPLGPVLLHCSGASGLEVLAPHARVGSLHPLMTFPGPEAGLPEPSEVPAAIAGSPEGREAAAWLARTVGFRTFEVPGDRRLYHAAAVLAGNLLTVLGVEAIDLLRAAGVAEAEAREVWMPLALGSLRHAPAGLAAALTGPVARGDRTTLEAHREALLSSGRPDLAEVYDLLTAHASRRLERERRRVEDSR